jgi:hypothetical protein
MTPLDEAETRKRLSEWIGMLEEPVAYSPLQVKLGILEKFLICQSLEVQMSPLDCALGQ